MDKGEDEESKTFSLNPDVNPFLGPPVGRSQPSSGTTRMFGADRTSDGNPVQQTLSAKIDDVAITLSCVTSAIILSDIMSPDSSKTGKDTLIMRRNFLKTRFSKENFPFYITLLPEEYMVYPRDCGNIKKTLTPSKGHTSPFFAGSSSESETGGTNRRIKLSDPLSSLLKSTSFAKSVDGQTSRYRRR